MPYSFETLSRELHEHSHAIVPFPVSKKEFEQAIQTYISFLALPQEVKDPLYFNIYSDEGRGGDVGYRKYRREQGKIDNREFFHYHTYAEEIFDGPRKRIPELDQLLSATKRIHDIASNTLSDILHAFEEKFPGIHGRFFLKDELPRFYLRVLKYDVATPGEFLANGHYDRGACTLALAESAPGLRMGVDDLHLKDVVHDEGKALFMAGLNFPELTSGEFRPTWHDVVQKSEDTFNTDIARWAIVFFADPSIKGKTTFEDRHTPQRIQSESM